MMNLFKLLTITVMISSSCLAQLQMMQFRHYTIGDGLSQNTVLAASQDSAGFLWFGTADGLNRFDGYRFKVYRNNTFDSTTISSGDISSIVHDKAGRCWVGTIKGGLNLLDPETDRFIHFNHIQNQPYSLCDDSVNTLYLDSLYLWIGTEHGLDRIKIPGEKAEGSLRDWNRNVRFEHLKVSQDSKSKNLGVTSIFRDHHGYCWVGTNNGLFVTPPESLHFFKFSLSKTRPGSMGSRYVRCIFEDIRGQIWVGTTYGGLNLLILPDSTKGSTRLQRIQKATCRSWMPESGDPGSSISSDVIYSIVEASPGVLWIGTENGLNRFEPLTGRFDHYKHDPENIFSLSNNTVWMIMRDRSGLFWIGTDGGLSTFHENQHQFQKFQHYPNDNRSLSNAYVWTITEDSEGDLWIGTFFGLNQFDPDTRTITRYFHAPGNKRTLGNNAILSSIMDHDGMLWLGLNGPGLDRALIQSGRPVSFIHMDRSSGELGNQTILTLYEDRDGALWIGTWDNGLQKILPRDRESLVHSTATKVPFIQYFHDPKNPDSISPNRIYTICQDRSGALWIGTDGDGINVLSENHRRVTDPAHEPVRFAHFRHDPEDPKSLSHNVVMCIFEDRQGNLWFGTYGGGLNLFHRDRYQFSHFTVNEGLPNNIVYGIQEDDQGYLWLSTNNGLSKFNPKTLEFHNFTAHDGLQDYEFNSGAAYKTKDGHLVFGGINGFNYFNPEDIYLNPYVPPMVISEFKVDNKPMIVIPDQPVRLSYKQNLISIEFSALNYIYPEKNRYRYKLNPIDKAWIESDTERKATYTHLAPGSYLFHVQGSNNDGVWNREGVTLYIQIDPPFWLTPWFRIFVLGLFLGIIYTIHYIRTLSIQKLNRSLEEKVHERTEALRLSNFELYSAMENVKVLEGLLPICASCKKVRDDKGYWHQVDVYIRDHSQVKFTHGLCPECYEKYDKEI